MKVVYVAGPYRSKKGINGIRDNINHAMDVARILWKEGYAVICPHGNTAFMDGKDIKAKVFLDGDLELLKRCDAMVLVGDWKNSKGTVGEVTYAKEYLDIPIFEWSELTKTALHNHSDKFLILE